MGEEVPAKAFLGTVCALWWILLSWRGWIEHKRVLCLVWLAFCLKLHANPEKRCPLWLSGRESTCRCGRLGFNLWVKKIPWRQKWQPTPVFLTGKSHGQRSLAPLSVATVLGVARELDTTKWLNNPIQSELVTLAILVFLEYRLFHICWHLPALTSFYPLLLYSCFHVFSFLQISQNWNCATSISRTWGPDL